jgi:hypothetical protein
MAGEKFTVTLAAKIKDFIANMKKAGKSLQTVKMQNRGLVKGIQEMNSSFNKSGKRFFQTSQKFKSGVDGIGRSTSGLSKKLAGTTLSLSALTPAAIAAGASIGVLAASFIGLRKALRAAEVGAAFKVQARAFANLVANQGVNAEKLVRQLQEASKGTLDTMSLITTASRALLLRIPANRLTELMDVARKASKAMGTTVAGAFSDISLGIGRQSRLILDNLGIIVRVGVAYDNYARKIGTTAGALTDFEKSQAFLNETLDQAKEKFSQSSPNIVDFRDRMDQIRTIALDASKRISVALLVPFEALSKTLADAGVGTAIKKFFEVDFPKDLQKLLLIGISFAKVIKIIATDLGTVGKFMNDWLIQIAEFTGFLDASRLFNKGLGLIFKSTKKVTEATGEMKEEVNDQGFWSNLIKNLEDGTSKTNSFLDALFGQGGDRPSLIDVAERQVISLNNALDDTVSKAADISAEFAKGLPQIEQGVESINKQVAEMEQLVDIFALDSDKRALEVLKRQRDKLQKELDALKKAEIEQVRPAQFLESKGLRSDERTIQAAITAADDMERLIGDFGSLGLTSQKEISTAGLKIFNDAKLNISALDKDLQERLLKSKKVFEDLVPDKTVKKVRELKKEMEEVVPVDSIRKGLNQWVDDYNNAGNRLSELGKSIATGMSQGFDNFFFDTITGKVNSLTDAFNNMFQSILRATTKFLGQKATQEFLGLAFGATGQTTQSQIGPTGGPGGLFGMFGKLFGRGATAPSNLGQPGTSSFGAGFPGTPSFVGPPTKAADSILGSGGGFGGIFSALKSIGSIFGFADGGIANLADMNGSGVLSTPSLAAIAEKPGKKEAVMPLEKFTDLVQPVNINISTVDTKSFQQYMMDNKEIVLGTLMGIKGSRTVDGMQRQQRGPF